MNSIIFAKLMLVPLAVASFYDKLSLDIIPYTRLESYIFQYS